MTRMIPATIHPAVRSGAERSLFTVFRDAPGTDEWVCLHSLSLAKHPTKRRGEIDFLLLTPKGIFVLEVKGGGVSRRGGVWRFTDRYNNVHEKTESPFDQAAGAMFALERDVREKFCDDQRRSHLLFGYGVMFPDIVFDETGSEAERQQLYDARDRSQPITEFIDRLAAFTRKSDVRRRYAPAQKDIELLVDFLRPDFDLVPPLSVRADAAVEELLSLAKEQYAVLDAWEQYHLPRVLVQGGAGTGKTLLALETAVREARKKDGAILLLCYNRLLAQVLEENVKAHHPDGGITIKSIYSLLNGLIESSSFASEFERKRAACDTTTLYSELYPEYALLALLESSPSPYKTLVIDEAQDMMVHGLLDVIDAYVEGGLNSGRWRIFCDVNNQASVFGVFEQAALDRLLKSGQPSILLTNRRNTRPVADETAMLTRPQITPPATVPGIPVQYRWYDTQVAQATALSKIVKRLLAEHVAPGRITILSPRNIGRCCAAMVSDPPLVSVSWNNVLEVATGGCRSVSYSTISAFKGLENDFIVLTDIEDLESEWWRSVIYVGMSRARVGLHLLIHESLKVTYAACVRQWIEERASDRERAD